METKFSIETFWKLSVKWWFFPLIYIILSEIALLYIINPMSNRNVMPATEIKLITNLMFAAPLYMGLGLQFIIDKMMYTQQNSVLNRGIGVVFSVAIPIFILISSIVLQKTYKSKGVILRWLVIILIVLIILTFGGCVAGISTDYQFISMTIGW